MTLLKKCYLHSYVVNCIVAQPPFSPTFSPLRLGGVKVLFFGGFWGEVKIFLFSGRGCPINGVYISFSHFEMHADFKCTKGFK